MGAGHDPTITGAAELAGISRATAYRYFPTQEMLLAEIALFEVGGPLFPAEPESTSTPEAVAHLVRRIGMWTYENAEPLRMLLRLSLDPATGVRRPGHRLEWIGDTLSPLRKNVDPNTYAKLANALTLLMGIDPVVVLSDIAGISREEALDTLEWCGRTLVEGALRDARRDCRG